MPEKYSRQRELLIDLLSERGDHPTADEIYVSMRALMPSVSLGTVYRNLASLSTQGRVRRIECDGPDRFDADTSDHYHFYCRECARLLDVEMNALEELLDAARKSGVGDIENYSVMFYGVCAECAQDQTHHVKLDA